MRLNMGNAGVFVFGKNIGELVFELRQYPVTGIDGNFLILAEIKRPYLVKAGGVVFVLVGKHHCIEPFQPHPQHLLAEIRAGIHHNTHIIDRQMDRGAQSFITEIGRATYFTLASD